MNGDLYPGIREACAYWPDAPMLQQTFEALQANLESDASIDAAKCIVECICRVIIDELDNPVSPLKPQKDEAPINEWVTASIRVLNLGDRRHRKFADLIKHHNGLAESLRVLRNDAGPLSHGKDGFIQVLTAYHRRAGVLAADAIVSFLHQAYLVTRPLNPILSREPWERFAEDNALIDTYIGLTVDEDAEEENAPTLLFLLPDGELPLKVEVSRLLYLLDRTAYVEALNAARNAEAAANVLNEEQGSE
ncbi:MAG: abortive infection family protein [Magnetococcales bacterium]|nr:abortive infection family protein [Magnetococcales bacterium]